MRARPFFGLARLSVPFAALVFSGATGAAAQTMVGTVTERGTGRPLAGVFVVLEDSAGGRAAGVLTDPDGNYILRAGAPGRYRYSAELIGYAGATGGWVELASGAASRQDIEVAVQAVSLDGITVETEERCRRGPGSGPETARLWEEARKALEVARWSEQQGVLRFQVVQHRRELDATTLRVGAQEERGRSGYFDRSPYRSVPAERLRAGGYVQRDANGKYDYFAPDAEVLLSESFLDTHCFRVASGLREEPHLVGLAFEPVPERALPDIDGVLWLERGSAELRRLDFTYRNLPFEHGEWPQVGGRVRFERLATGMWIVRRWRIRMPLVARRTGGFGGAQSKIELVTVSEEGAEVRSVTARDGRVIAEAVGATLYGTVTTPGSDAPLSGATVEVVGTEHRTLTSDDGTYRLTGLPDGTYRIRARHPDLALLGIGGTERDVELVAGRAVRTLLEAGLAPDRAHDFCTRRGWTGGPDGAVVVYGVVLGPDGESPAPGVLVRLWSEAPERRVLADSLGAFVVCLPPSDQPVRFAAVEPGAGLVAVSLATVDTVAAESGFLRVDVPFTPTPRRAASPGTRSTWTEGIVGRVLIEGTDRPIAGASVSLMDSAGAFSHRTVVTDDRGAFTLTHPGRGSHFTLEVRHVAYGTARSGIQLPRRQELRVDVGLTARAIALEPIVVTERRRDFLAAEGFYDRRDRGFGIFVAPEEIERRLPSRITDLLTARPAIRLVQVSPFAYDIRIMGTERLASPKSLEGSGFAACQPAVYLDGSKVRGGGEPAPADLAISDIITADLLGGMEVYTHASRVPPRFGGADAACGVVVLWTKGR